MFIHDYYADTANSAISTPFGDWQQTGGYPDVLRLCDLVLGSKPTEFDLLKGVQAFGDRFRAGYLSNCRLAIEEKTLGMMRALTLSTIYQLAQAQWMVILCGVSTHMTRRTKSTTLIVPQMRIDRGTGSFATSPLPLGPSQPPSWSFRAVILIFSSGAPAGKLSLVSRKLNPAYYQHQCDLYFPKVSNYTYGLASGKTIEDLNTKTGGWSRTNTSRIIWTNG